MLDDKNNLYKFKWDCGRMGNIEGFVLISSNRINELVGTKIDFGEVLGKHSNISANLSLEDFELISDDHEFIKKANEIGLIPSGYDPRHYLEE